ncbi:hypothetical protein SE17_13840 [Kouleothrix aurantiaca]|uniref:Uncharacterized protein n=1 Tax=Kouleothrix aurantiaca TaxID=186479 RepID=A0A0P9F824_9CHLR|nr:hypothetical protein SE17_13840 [Kouleothrix aurantiaca]
MRIGKFSTQVIPKQIGTNLIHRLTQPFRLYFQVEGVDAAQVLCARRNSSGSPRTNCWNSACLCSLLPRQMRYFYIPEYLPAGNYDRTEGDQGAYENSPPII